MRQVGIAGLLVVFIVSAGPALFSEDRDDRSKMPYMSRVEPTSAKVGDVVTVLGENLDESCVAEVYLTNGKVDLKTEILDRTEKFMKIRVPAKASPGRFRLMILVDGPQPRLMEEPVALIVQ